MMCMIFYEKLVVLLGLHFWTWIGTEGDQVLKRHEHDKLPMFPDVETSNTPQLRKKRKQEASSKVTMSRLSPLTVRTERILFHGDSQYNNHLPILDNVDW